MRNSRLTILLLFIVSLLSPAAVAYGGKRMPDTFLKTRVDRKSLLAGERVIYEVVLFTADPEIAGVEMVSPPIFSGLPFTRSFSDTALSETQIDGRKYYTAVIDRYFVGCNEKGKFSIKGGVYDIGEYQLVRYNDFFTGPDVRRRVVVSQLQAPDCGLTVADLPEKGRPSCFSGAVGDFKVSAYLHSNDTREGEDACLMVTVSGFGDLTDSSLPEIVKAFPPELRFKSMTDSRSHYVKDGRLGSEIEIECVFHPRKAGVFKVEGIEFCFYDSVRHRYRTAVAPALVIDVGEAPATRSSPPVVEDI